MNDEALVNAVKMCLNQELGSKVPQFICTAKGNIKVGTASLSSLRSFAKECEK
jgi:hypothetical protein